MPVLQGVTAIPSPTHQHQHVSIKEHPQLYSPPPLRPSEDHLMQTTSPRQQPLQTNRLAPQQQQHRMSHYQGSGGGEGSNHPARQEQYHIQHQQPYHQQQIQQHQHNQSHQAGPLGGSYASEPSQSNGYAAASSPSSSRVQQPAQYGNDGGGPSNPALLGVPRQMPTTAASLMREGPRDFAVIKAVGDGSFGSVCLADWKSPLPSGTLLSPMQHPTTRPEYIGKRLVAIKRMKKPFKNWNDCLKLKELKSLLDIPPHPNLIPLYDAFLDPSTKELHFVFECMEGNLYQLTKSRKGRPLAGGLVASIFKQIIDGLHHIHQHGYFHRDMKPENLLITTTGLDDYPAFTPPGQQPTSAPEKDVIVIVKLADFGLARETASEPPYTEYVSTRWYRAPEVLLRSRDYSSPVDMWALGTILAELVNLKPLFPGDTEVDQVLQICDILGDPTPSYGRDSRGRQRGGGGWERGIRMANAVGFQWPKTTPVKFSSLFSSRTPIELIDCMEDLMRYDPELRATTNDCLRHPYFSNVAPRLQPIKSRAPISVAAMPARSQDPQNQQARLQQIAPQQLINPTAARTSLPPSHSNMTSANKPVFGDGAQPHRMPFFRQDLRSPHSDSTSGSGSPHFLQNAQQHAVQGAEGGYTQPQGGAMVGSAAQQYQQQQQNAWAMTQQSSTLASSGAQLDRNGGMSSQNQHQQHHHPMQTHFTSQQQMAPIGVQRAIYGQQPGMASNALSSTSLDANADSGKFASASPAAETVPITDPKKAKKEAEKAAKQAEKAKRAAQEKAARDRARAVMQKRNQLLASSETKETVEWLSNPPAQPVKSEKARGKQPISPLSSPRAHGGFMPNEASNNLRSSQPYGFATHSAAALPYRPMFGSQGFVPSRMGDIRDRPISMQSYATGDSDPGPPGAAPMPGHPALRPRQHSSSSLSSGLDSLSHDRHSARYRTRPPDSVDSHRSNSSLDPQLVSNMEAMTAAEARRSASPGPNHIVGGSRASTGRSRASSIQRGGSASPLHHQTIPRFHPYGMPGAGPPASSHSQASSQSHYSAPGYQMFSLQSLEDERRRQGRPPTMRRQSSHSNNQRLTISRGSVSSNVTDPASFALASPRSAQVPLQYQASYNHYMPQQGGMDGGATSAASGGLGINPMWGTDGSMLGGLREHPQDPLDTQRQPPPLTYQQQRLPSFSSFVATTRHQGTGQDAKQGGGGNDQGQREREVSVEMRDDEMADGQYDEASRGQG